MKPAFSKGPSIYGDRFKHVWMWHEWPDGSDTGIDLVAEEREDGLCAIQCKFFDPHRLVPSSGINSFLAKSEPPQYTSRFIINTGGSIQRNTLRLLEDSPKPCRVLDAAERLRVLIFALNCNSSLYLMRRRNFMSFFPAD